MIHEKEKGHLAADVDVEVELFLKEQLYKIDSSIGFYGEETGGCEFGLAVDFVNCSPMQPGRQRWIVVSPAMNLCNIARGRIDEFIDFGCSMEGQAAGGYILEKAGGKMLNYDKSPWNHFETGKPDKSVKHTLFRNLGKRTIKIWFMSTLSWKLVLSHTLKVLFHRKEL